MMYYIMLPCYLIVWGVIAFIMNNIAKPKGYLLLGVKLPQEEMKRPEVLEILKKYKRHEKIISLGMFLFAIGGWFLRNFSIISTLYSLVWVFGALGVMQLEFFRVYDELYALKKEQGWVVGEQTTISIDTEVARLKSHFVYPKWNWLVVLMLTAIGCLLWVIKGPDDMLGIIMASVNVVTFVVLLGIYLIVPRVKTTLYSKSSDVNVALNRSFCYELTKAMVWCGYANAVIWMISAIVQGEENIYLVIIVTASLSTLFVCAALFYAAHRISRERRLFQQMKTVDYVTDDDIYWRGGLYSNPHDPKLWVEKRNGFGMQMNGAHPVGKVVNVLATLLIVGMFAWLVILIPLDFPSLNLHISGDILYVEATQYDQEIAIDKIESAELITELPRMYKNNGYADREYDFGQFRVIGYGQSKVYVNEEHPLYLVLYVGDTTYIINSDDEEELQTCIALLEDRSILTDTEE